MDCISTAVQLSVVCDVVDRILPVTNAINVAARYRVIHWMERIHGCEIS